ncbi:hypothetical protein TNIN_279501 [Trichonephila inaurata madagascariensis]|uniref:Uncharacterized protein n=1 Tax=Trichonephila inaurata madagascariensis TaxID=2747483 RepID=A0A8X6KII0_9ARAC|nr:hypothetical protein TNIN_279501 [Trichonephila inaurata madagascariensis]
MESRQEITIMDLDKYSDAELIDFMYSRYRRDIQSYFTANFIADSDFHLLIYTGWIFITVENKYRHLIEFLASQKFAMYSGGSKSTVYAFYADNRELAIGDFDILKNFWKLVKYIRRIDIESHKTVFLRCKPQSLTNLSLAKMQAYNLRPSLPDNVLQKLGINDFS